ncbi:general transcription factor II-I repeat domain-containing protein 2-like [Hydra vulgaris]|uniref:General transcription factor II-I repeat domain-containing protein 2-like n=1 Tax=Hydra vulgaris TaxID=6087 RepID=A0ABM4BZL6_HYDVU
MNISSSSKESNITTEASFIIAWNIAKSKHPYTDGEFVKQNLFDVISVLVAKFKAFSLALDKSTDIKDKPQMAVFVRYVTSDVLVKEELLDLDELKDTTRGIDLKEALDTVLVKANAPKNKLVSVATDGATAMVGKHIGFIGLLNSDSTYPEFSQFIVELDLADKPSDLLFYCAVRRLSNSDVLYRFVELLEPIKCFLLEKQKTFEIFGDGKEKDILDLAHTIFSFQKKLAQFQKDLTLKTFNHFPQMKMIHNLNPTIQYDDLNLFLIDIISNGCPIPENILEETSQFEIEFLDLQEDQNLQMLQH